MHASTSSLLNQGMALHQAGNLAAAEGYYLQALKANPRDPNASHLLGVLRGQQGEAKESLKLIEKAVRLAPGVPMFTMNYGNALAALERHLEAIEQYDRALVAAPDHADVWSNRASSLRAVGRGREALVSAERALRIAPGMAEAWCIRGEILFESGRVDEALQSLNRALALKPQLPRALFTKAQINMQAEAIPLLDSLIKLNPGNVTAHWMRALAALPMTALPEVEAANASKELSVRIDALRALGLDEAHQGIGALTLFGLTYQEQNNRPVFAKYGALVADAMAHWQARQQPVCRPSVHAGSRVRLCIVSGHLREHSVWHAITRGLVEHLDRNRFELQLVHLDDAQPDAETIWAKAHCDRFEEGRRSFAAWRDAIAAGAPDVILYPEIGMDPTNFKLAGLRLAPAQVTTWGHPHTTGLPTVDVFVSADAFEPADADQHYTERLVRLPGVGCCFAPHAVANVEPDLAQLGIDADGPILLSPGTPYKYAPQHDWVLAEIAGRLGGCRLVFFANRDHGDLGGRMRDRLTQAFAARGLDFAERCAIIPWQSRSTFYALMRRADLMLDTIGFSGFNTAMGALECGLPIVAYEGRFMRGRFASGLLRSIDLGEFVANDPQSYVELAVSLASDPRRRERAHRHIIVARERLFHDLDAIRAWQAYLLDMKDGKIPSQLSR